MLTSMADCKHFIHFSLQATETYCYSGFKNGMVFQYIGVCLLIVFFILSSVINLKLATHFDFASKTNLENSVMSRNTKDDE